MFVRIKSRQAVKYRYTLLNIKISFKIVRQRLNQNRKGIPG